MSLKNNAELIDALIDICIRQAKIIRKQAFMLEQLGVAAQEEDIRLQDIIGGMM